MKKLIALLLAVVMVLSMAACGKNQGATPDEPTKAPDTTEVPTDAAPFVPELGEGVFSKTSYTVSDKEVTDANAVVVATVGNCQLTLGQLQVYYWMSVYGFLQEYGAYASYFGLDLSKPLDQQACPETEGTWQQYFLDMALDSWHSYQTLALQSEKEQSPMDPELQAELDAMPDNMQKAAEQNGHASLEELLTAPTPPVPLLRATVKRCLSPVVRS